MGDVTFVMPWPPAVLGPNARHHWRVVAKAKKSLRATAYAEAMRQGAAQMHGKLSAHFVFYPPTRRHYDQDNLLSRSKALIDGLADAIRVDDRHWRMSLEIAAETGGRVEVTISEL